MNAKHFTAPGEARTDPFGLVGTRLDSRYEVGELVAQGGFGVVYRALHRELRKPVAIKVLKTPSELSLRQQAEFFQRFAEEARTVGQLDHPHVVRVLDFGTSIMPSGAKAPWMALEWMEGVTLESDFNLRIESGSSGRSARETMALMYPVIEAVGIAHEEGIVHRDIKPGNLMIVTGRRGDARLKLLDFGIAKVMAPEERRASDRAQTLTQVQAFSPDYAAPEQVSGMRTGPWTDVHALALLMSEMLTARVPFLGDDAMEMCSNVLAPTRPTPGQLGVDVGPWEEVFARALSLKPSDRYNNAAEFLTALMDHLPPGVDIQDAQLWVSQTGTHRLTPTAGLDHRTSSSPSPPRVSAREPTPSNPTIAEGMNALGHAPIKQHAPTFRPPPPAASHPPTFLSGPVLEPPRGSYKPPPYVSTREELPEFAVPEPEPVFLSATPYSATPYLGPPDAGSPYPASAITEPPPSNDQGYAPFIDSSLDTEPAPRTRSFAGPLLVVIGLFFGGLVASAAVLLLRRPPSMVQRPNQPVAVTVLRRPAVTSARPSVVAPPAPSVVAPPVAAPVPPPVEAPVEAVHAHGHHREHGHHGTHEHHHGTHEHHHSTHDHHHSRRDVTLPAE